MEKWDSRLFRQEAEANAHQHRRNVVELEVLESRRQMHLKVNELIQLATNSTLNTAEIRQQLLLGAATFGNHFAPQLVRSLQRDDPHERQSVVWLLTLLNDARTVTPLRHMSHNRRLPRPIRLSAALALAGMGATEESKQGRRERLYAIS
ncbi:MAG TPA: hypothetical protein VFA09_07295 [Ktedonobacteraceae bacterium]|nr:hypothetical protein [Ktedonosporobacter sp.]HZU67067.1 hypothetical protein [Ktedonobacteraceae bacterium]